MCKYQLHQQVEVIVESIQPYGVFVRLNDGTRAYIRRRELDLDADVDPERVVHKGDKITAKVIALETGKNIELSRRATLPNPWRDFARRFREGDVVHGTVRALHPKGVFVRVEAGIGGFVPLDELTTWQLSKPEELLWIGDEVEAIITHLDTHNERLALSIKARMEQRAQATQSVIKRLDEQRVEGAPIISKDELPLLTPGECERVGQIIVIENEDGIRNGLVAWLQQRGYRACSAQTREEVETQIRSGGRSVLFVDIHLDENDGLELIQGLSANGNGVVVCVMSIPDVLLERSEEIRAAKVSQVFDKPLDRDAIDHFLRRLARGETIQPTWKILPRPKEDKAESQALNLALRDVAPTRRLQAALEKVVGMARAEKGFVFIKEPTSQTISIVAETGDLPLRKEALYGLRESPVKDVVVEQESVVEGRAAHNKRFVKLLDLLTFESCIGAPIEAMGEVRHALFLFHRQPEMFARVRPQYIELDTLWLSTILEERAVNERLRAVSPLLLSGELAVGLAHEVYNKVDALELQLSNLVSPKPPPTDLQNSLVVLHNAARDLKSLTGSFQEMMRAKELPTAFNINDVVRRAEMLVRPQAREKGVKIDLHLADNLPQITGNSIALQQVFFNIMLNAVQLMALKPDKHRLLEISTTYQPDRKRSLWIRFADTGPGIHSQLWEKIFELGFSARGGSGLGLYIAHSLIEMFDGKIKVEESAIPLGATFLVKLPVAKQEKEK